MVAILEKLVCVIMGQNCEKFLPMCLESVREADAIVYCDGGSTDKTIKNLIDLGFHRVNHHRGEIPEFRKGWLQKWIIHQEYNQEDKQMNGKQRNFYLNYLKQNYPNDWCLCLDADEVLDDEGLDKIKAFIQEAIPGIYSIKMRHFEGDLGHEDAAVPMHLVYNRLFKISEAGDYPEVEHPLLVDKNGEVRSTAITSTTIWHLAYAPNMWILKHRYENHLKKSNMHTPEYLKMWYYSHLFGQYPKSVINLIDIPEIILNEFGIDKDEFYFMDRKLEVRHFLMMKQWITYWRNWAGCSPEIGDPVILDYGAGLGAYGAAAVTLGCDYEGIELSKFAVKTNPFGVRLTQGDIRINRGIPADIILCLDVLEHLEEADLEKALTNIEEPNAMYIFSIPFLGDPNLKLDNTHKIHQSKEWWVEKLSKHFKITNAPKEWMFSHQLLIGEKQ